MSAFKEKIQIKAIIFDLDGTLLDTETLSSKAMQTVLNRYNKKETWDLKSRILGLRGEEWGPIVVESLGLLGKLDPAQLVREWENNLNDLCPQVMKMPGADNLTNYFRSASIPLAIATSSSKEAMMRKRDKHRELFDRMDITVTGDHPLVARGKPNPDMYLATAKYLGVDPRHCLVFEDALSGVLAAVSAGMSCVAVPDSRLDLTCFRELTPFVHTSLEEVDLTPFDLQSARSLPSVTGSVTFDVPGESGSGVSVDMVPATAVDVLEWSRFCEECFARKPQYPPPASFFRQALLSQLPCDLQRCLRVTAGSTEEVEADTDISQQVSSGGNKVFIARTGEQGEIVAALRVIQLSLSDRPIQAQTSSAVTVAVTVGGICDVCTHPTHRRKGYSSMLLSHAQGYIEAMGWDVALLHASESVQPLYRSIGFRKTVPVEWSLIHAVRSDEELALQGDSPVADSQCRCTLLCARRVAAMTEEERHELCEDLSRLSRACVARWHLQGSVLHSQQHYRNWFAMMQSPPRSVQSGGGGLDSLYCFHRKMTQGGAGEEKHANMVFFVALREYHGQLQVSDMGTRPDVSLSDIGRYLRMAVQEHILTQHTSTPTIHEWRDSAISLEVPRFLAQAMTAGSWNSFWQLCGTAEHSGDCEAQLSVDSGRVDAGWMVWHARRSTETLRCLLPPSVSHSGCSLLSLGTKQSAGEKSRDGEIVDTTNMPTTTTGQEGQHRSFSFWPRDYF